MAIAQVGSATTATSSNVNGGAGLSCNKPTGVSSGDVLIAHLTLNDSTITSSGWTQFEGGVISDASNHFESLWFYKVAGGSEPSSYTFTKDGAASASPVLITIMAFSGVDTTTGPIGGSASVTNTGNHSEPYSTGTCTSSGTSLSFWSRATRYSDSTGSKAVDSLSASGVTETSDIEVWSGSSVTYQHADYKATSTGTGNASSLGISDSQTETHSVLSVFTLLELATSTNANAGAVSATGTAYAPTVAIGAPAGAVSAPVSVKDTARFAQAGQLSASASAKTPAGGVSAAAGSVGASASVKDVGRRASPTAAAATGTVSNGSIPVLADAGAVTAHATTNRPTLTGTNVSAAPELAVAAVQVHQSDTSAVADFGTGAGTAYDAAVDIGSAPDAVAATATAYDASIAVEIPSGFSSASTTVSAPGITDSAAPMADGFLVTVTVPQVSTVINGNPAQSVSATGAAFDIDYIRSEVVGKALATVAVYQPTMFFGSTRVIKVASSNRTEVVDSDTRTLIVEAA